MSEVYYTRHHLWAEDADDPELVAYVMKGMFGSIVDTVVEAGLNPLDGTITLRPDWDIDDLQGYKVDCQWRPHE